MIAVQELPEIIVPGRRLGRHQEHDHRSRAYSVAAGTGPVRSVTWEVHGPVLNQGDIGSCTGNAVVGLLMSEPLHVPGRDLDEEDAVRIYSAATRVDRIPGFYPPDDTGSSGLAVMKVIKREGLIAAYHHAFGLDAALRGLRKSPVITGTAWFTGFDRPEGDRAVVSIAGESRGGHEYLVYGVDVENGYVLCRNSWGAGYGDRGHFVMTFETWRQLLKLGGDVTVAIPPL